MRFVDIEDKVGIFYNIYPESQRKAAKKMYWKELHKNKSEWKKKKIKLQMKMGSIF